MLAATKGAELKVYEFEDAASGEVLDRAGLTACREFTRKNAAHYFVCMFKTLKYRPDFPDPFGSLPDAFFRGFFT